MIVSGVGFVFFLIGHLAIWCTVFNQIHATRCPRSARRGSELLTLINVVVLGLVGLYLALFYPSWIHPVFGWLRLWLGDASGKALGDWSLVIMVAYWHVCSLVSLFFIVRWGWWRWRERRPEFFVEEEIEYYDFDDEDPELLHGLPTQLAHALVPGNQLLELSVEFKTFEFAALPLAFDGYRICHLSDLHFTGRIGRAYFHHVIDRCLQWEPDLICLTGDLVDRPRCLDWIEEILGRLKAPDGVYFILGNHDRRIKDHRLLRTRLADSGLVDVNGRYQSIERRWDGRRQCLWLAGNERPWFDGAEALTETAGNRSDETEDFFIALCHSPDQWPWAEQLGFNLMLAGHTHGGQVRLPLIGPIIAPSRFGVRYAGGVFQVGRLAMQVSRGISGADPLRWNCPPELAQITLRQP